VRKIVFCRGAHPEVKQVKQYKYNVTMRCVRATMVAVEKQ